jgi:hypothetical protein
VSSPVWGSWPDIYYCLTVTVLFLWVTLSDERTGVSFVYAAGPCQRSLCRVRVPWDSWPYFTVSDLRLPSLSPRMIAGPRWRYSTPPQHGYSRAEQSRAEAYCRQLASTVALGIEPRWDPWPYICSLSRLFFSSSFVVPPLIKGIGWAFFVIGVPLLHLFHPRSHWSRGYIHIIHFHKTQTDSKFYYIEGHLSMQDSAAAYASTY